MRSRSSIRTRLVALFLIPTFALLVVVGIQLTQALGAASAANDVEALARAAEANRNLVNGLQQERALSIESVVGLADAAADEGAGQALLDAREQVAQARTEVDATIVDSAVLQATPSVIEIRAAATRALDGLEEVRADVGDGDASPQAITAAFDRPIQLLLDAGQGVLFAVEDPEVDQLLWASLAISRYKDAAFRSADLVTLVQAGVLDREEAAEALGPIQAEQATWLAAAQSQLPPQRQAELADAVVDIPTTGMLIAAFASAPTTAESMTDLSATDALLRSVEDDFYAAAVDAAEDARDATRTTAVAISALALVVLAVMGSLLLLLLRNVLSPLRHLTGLADGVRESLPDAVRRLASGEAPEASAFESERGMALVERDDELGDLARAIESSTGEATRVALGQAQTRAGITRTIEDVARREQTLVERQLALLDQLEDREEDPDQLAQLFRLDHLATRMRRNAENLLLLSSGRLPGGHDTSPVPLVDVIRTAAAEIEHYARVDVRVGVAETLVGYAATPVSHLLAEVIENATQFSPPSTRVAVTARAVDTGIVVQVVDQGLGMSPADIEDARRRLVEQPLLEAAESRRLGLYVVGLIASRLGIGVDLRASDGGQGLTVDVHLPSLLFQSGAGQATNPADQAQPGVPSLPDRSTTAPAPTRPGVHAATPPPEALSALGSLLDAELSTPPDLPEDVTPAPVLELPLRNAALPRREREDDDGPAISLSAASAGRTVDLDPAAVSALMAGLSHDVDPAPPGDAWAPEGWEPSPTADAGLPTWDPTSTPDLPSVDDDPYRGWDAPPAAPAAPQPPPAAAPPVEPAPPADHAADDAPPPDLPPRRSRGVASSWSTPFPQQGGSR